MALRNAGARHKIVGLCRGVGGCCGSLSLERFLELVSGWSISRAFIFWRFECCKEDFLYDLDWDDDEWDAFQGGKLQVFLDFVHGLDVGRDQGFLCADSFSDLFSDWQSTHDYKCLAL